MEIDHESESKRRETSNDVVIDIQNPYLELATALRNELDSFQPFSGQCTIHRVPQNLRQLDEKAYTPRVVSIGPIHHGREELKAMEEYKRRYVQNFLQRTKVPLEDFIKVIKEKEAEMRNCYAETIKLKSDEFVKMILIDAAFIFEVLLIRISHRNLINDRIYGNPRMRYDVMDDLYMLENQLPFFILMDLFTSANIHISSNKDEKLSFLEIIHTFTRYRWEYLGIEETFDESKFERVKHLLHFLRICIVPPKLPLNKGPEILTTPSVTELHQAGVKFKLGSSKNLFGIRFKNGILEIPRITIRSPLEYLMKNLLAFEQSQCRNHMLNDYVIFMNYLVNTPKDAQLLAQHEIIHNPIGDSELVSTLFHRFVERPTFHPDYFYFSPLIGDLNVYCRRPWHKWKATLKQDYFKTPWTTVSVIAAVVLLILTLIQSVCSIVQVR